MLNSLTAPKMEFFVKLTVGNCYVTRRVPFIYGRVPEFAFDNQIAVASFLK